MGAEQEKKEDSSSRRYYGYYDPYGSRGDDKKKSDDKFRVGANVADNQLLLWCNEHENKEVLNLLTKLGELPPAGSRPNPFRTIDATRKSGNVGVPKEASEKWRTISPNPLKLPTPQDVTHLRIRLWRLNPRKNLRQLPRPPSTAMSNSNVL